MLPAPVLSPSQQTLKSLVWDPLIMAGETWLFAAVPILETPILKQVDEEIISLVSNYIFNNLIMIYDLEKIKFVNPIHQKAYERASEELAIVAQTNGMTSDAYKKALDTATTDFVNFVHFGV